MIGGVGNDTYFVDDGLDQVVENASAGTDAVFTTVHFILPANVETLVLQGSADLPRHRQCARQLDLRQFRQQHGSTARAPPTRSPATPATTPSYSHRASQRRHRRRLRRQRRGGGHSLHFVGYGAGATFTNIDATHWQVNFNGGATHESSRSSTAHQFIHYVVFA